eukprot:3062363-Lingulodinium_polyedra.AAC.1
MIQRGRIKVHRGRKDTYRGTGISFLPRVGRRQGYSAIARVTDGLEIAGGPPGDAALPWVEESIGY